MKARSGIDWSNPPEPVIFASVTLSKKSQRPGLIADGQLILLPRAGKTGVGVWLAQLIYYVREACKMYPVFREELEDMLAKLPRST